MMYSITIRFVSNVADKSWEWCLGFMDTKNDAIRFANANIKLLNAELQYVNIPCFNENECTAKENSVVFLGQTLAREQNMRIIVTIKEEEKPHLIFGNEFYMDDALGYAKTAIHENKLLIDKRLRNVP